jgi:predicted phosphodiesterase
MDKKINKNLWFIGDTHGNDNHIKWVIKQKNLLDRHLIHVGDFGIGFISKEQDIKNLETLNTFLKNRELTLHVFRGNHDDPSYFKGDFLLSNLKLHEDYTILELEGKRILGIGGALSIDRVYRAENNLGYWEDEVLVYDEEKLKDIKDIDILVTHTTMNFLEPRNSGESWPPIVERFIPYDTNLPIDLMNERKIMTNIYDKLIENGNNITNHFYGHFHKSYFQIIGGTHHRMLSINEFYELIDYEDYENELNERYGV